jgi:nuclear protein 1
LSRFVKSSFAMSESHFDKYEHYNFDQEKAMYSGHSGKQRSKKEAEQHTNHHNPGGHERKILQKFQNTEQKAKTKDSGPQS